MVIFQPPAQEQSLGSPGRSTRASAPQRESLMDGSLPLVSIVCPAYEEELVLPLFHLHLSEVLQRLESHYRFEILFVDDGSCDRTLEVLQALAGTDPRVSYLSLSRN